MAVHIDQGVRKESRKGVNFGSRRSCGKRISRRTIGVSIQLSSIGSRAWLRHPENMEEYIRRYERAVRELKRTGGGEIEKEVRGWHLLGQTGLEELEEQVVVGACHTRDGYDHIKGELIRKFGEKGKKEGKSWLERGRVQKVIQQGDTGRGCFVCEEVGHWARGCKKKNDSGNVRCYTGGEKRHVAQWCRNRRVRVRCWKCGVEGL